MSQNPKYESNAINNIQNLLQEYDKNKSFKDNIDVFIKLSKAVIELKKQDVSKAIDLLRVYGDENVNNSGMHFTSLELLKKIITTHDISNEQTLDLIENLFRNLSSIGHLAVLKSIRESLYILITDIKDISVSDNIITFLLNKVDKSNNIHVRATALEALGKISNLKILNENLLEKTLESIHSTKADDNQFISMYKSFALMDVIDTATERKLNFDYLNEVSQDNKYTPEEINKVLNDTFIKASTIYAPELEYAKVLLIISQAFDDDIEPFLNILIGSPVNVKNVSVVMYGIEAISSKIKENKIVDAIRFLLNQHASINESYASLILIRDTLYRIIEKMSISDSVITELVDLLINRMMESDNIHIRATSIESLYKMVGSLDLNRETLTRVVESLLSKQGDSNRFVAIYAKQGFFIVAKKMLELNMHNELRDIFESAADKGDIIKNIALDTAEKIKHTFDYLNPDAMIAKDVESESSKTTALASESSDEVEEENKTECVEAIERENATNATDIEKLTSRYNQTYHNNDSSVSNHDNSGIVNNNWNEWYILSASIVWWYDEQYSY